MSDYTEQNIRNVLKEVFHLYADVKNLIFTTYNFEPDFFEEHIITYLMGSDKKISTIGELNETNKWICENGVAVYYDKGALISGNSCVTLPVYPQYVQTGVFHPKVIIVNGKLLEKEEEATHIIVSSCNLTVSGYGRNQEAFSCIKVESEMVAESLLAFIDKLCEGDVSRHDEVRHHLKYGKFNQKRNVEFFWNYGKTGISLAQRFSQLPGGKMNIISPYFDKNGPEILLDDIQEKGEVCIFPAVDGEVINIYRSDYEKLRKRGVKFALPGVQNEENRFVHAKIITKGNYACVGSYNFTTAAMKQKNAEAALIFEMSEEQNFSAHAIEEDRFLQDNEEIVNRDEMAVSRDRVFVSVTVDWKENKMLVHSELPDTKDVYILKIDGVEGVTGWNISGGDLDFSLNDVTGKGLLKQKQFSVYQENLVCFRGLINEINWQGIRPEIGCESLDETMAEWFDYDTGKNNGHVYELRSIREEDKLTEKITGGDVEPAIDIFDNYYLVSRALGNLHKEIEENDKESKKECPVKIHSKRFRIWDSEVQKAEEALYGILFAYTGSMTQILHFLEKNERDENKKQDVVYAWLICKYLREAVKRMPESLDRIELFEEKKKEFDKNLTRAEERYREKIAGEVSAGYLNWVEHEIMSK